ncbi:MAG: LAGLIDADG family homing endonuclease [Candidatus Micrarchaeota archaeon]
MGDELLTCEQLLADYKVGKKHLNEVRHWFPIRPTPELAGLAAALISDGHIDWNNYDGNPRPKKLILYSNDPQECEWFLGTVWRLFCVRGEVVKYCSNSGYSANSSYKAVVYCAVLARILILLGVPAGDKTTSPFAVPKWVLGGSREIKKEFLRVLFNFDGSLSMRTRRETAIEMNYSMNKHEAIVSNGQQFLLQVKELLSDFGVTAGRIHVRPCAGDKYTILLFVTNHLSILNFHENIGFLGETKRRKLETAVSIITKHRRTSGGSDVLRLLKEKVGSDRAAISRINKLSQVKCSLRQFEHMRRGESLIPVDMVNAALKILNEKTG